MSDGGTRIPRRQHRDGTSYPVAMPWYAKLIWFLVRPLNRWSER